MFGIERSWILHVNNATKQGLLNHGVELIPVTVFDNAFRHYNLTLTLHLYLQITVRNIKLQFP